MNTDIPITQAIIPAIGETIKSIHLHSLAEAFNSRILNAAGDAHWRIPYYIFSTYFRKPRLNNDMRYAPDSEFFDFYQFVNPSTNDTWPVEQAQQPEGVNLQTNFLNRFIFGMNYERKEDVPSTQQVGTDLIQRDYNHPGMAALSPSENPGGYYVYEREDVRAKKAQDLMKENDSRFRGSVFPYFNDIGAISATDSDYTAFGVASEIHSPGYISGQPTNPAGNSFGGYYGSRPTVITGDGCGNDKDSQTGLIITSYPSSKATLYKLDGLRSEKKSTENPIICANGIGEDGVVQYSNVYNYIYNYIVKTTTINSDAPPSVSGRIYPKNKYHLDQYQSGVFFGREQKNHIHRLLYNYITYAKTFDFDWFFKNQYAYAPEIGSLNGISFTYSGKSTDANIGAPSKIEFQILTSRPSFNQIISDDSFHSGSFIPDGIYNIKIYFNSNTLHSYKLGDRVHLVFTNIQNALVAGLPEEGDYIINSVNINANSNYFTVLAKQAFSLSGSGFKVEIKPYLKIDGDDPDFKRETIKQQIFALSYFSNVQNPSPEVFSNDKKLTIDFLSLAGYLDQNYNEQRLLGSLHTGVDKFTVVTQNVADHDYYYGLEIPLFYALHSFEISASNLKTFTIRLHLFINNKETAFRDFDYDFSKTNNSIVISDVELATLNEKEVFSFKLSLQSFTAKVSGGIDLTIRPVFLMYYKPKIEDAYAMLRAATYSGIDDAKLDETDHPLKTSSNLSDDLKNYGYIRSSRIPEYFESHLPGSNELNTNALFETSRRLSLFTRIVNGETNFVGFQSGKVLKFNRYARQSGNVAMIAQGGKKPKYNGQVTLTRAYGSFINYSVFVANDLQTINSIKTVLTEIVNTDDALKAIESYSGFHSYRMYEQNGKLLSDFDADLIKALGSTTTIVSKNDLEFKTLNFTVNYDTLLRDEVDIYYEYYKFEDVYGNVLSDENGFYIIKFTPENRQSELGYEKIYLAIDPDTNLPILSVSIDQSKMKDGKVYIFTRSPDNTCLKTKLIASNDFFYIDKNSNLILKAFSNIAVCNYLGDFPVAVSSNNREFEVKNSEIIIKHIWSRNSSDLLSDETILETDKIKTITLSLNDLKEIGNILYNSYASDNIYLVYSPTVKYQGTLAYNPNGNFTDADTATSINSPFDFFNYTVYNLNVAGHKINISYLSNIFPEVKKDIDFSELLKNATITLTLTSSNIPINYSFNQDIVLPKFASDSDSIKLDISVNNYKRRNNVENYDKDTELPVKSIFLNPPVYLYIKNSVYKTDDFDNIPINREGSLFMTRTVDKIDTSEDLPETRDIFQGIAPDYNGVATGSLLIGEKYFITGGSISHGGVTITGVEIFTATSTQFSILSGNPVVCKGNGIISIAPPQSFTNEWALWINFLPYSSFSTSVFKSEAYGAVNSPFIDRCHVNSLNLPKSLENRHLNYNLPSAYAPEAPPSYRYMPLSMPKPYLVFENVVTSSESTKPIIENFQLGCPAFKPPYKIIKVSISKSTDEDYNNTQKDIVYVELDREIEGYSAAHSVFRTDYNGLNDWLAKKLSFKYGDAALTHKNGISQIASMYGNGYLGSYYPRFFFVKLIPKPKIDGNFEENETDTPLYHEHLKQAELYLEAMREGFTENRTTSKGSSCSIVGGYLTPPDFKYDQLLFNSTSTAEYFGNRWPSLNTFSYHFNKVGNSFPIRHEDNPVGYAAIPNLGAYAEQYVSIAESINNLISFRVPYPIDFIITQESRNDNYVLDSNQWLINNPYVKQGGGGGPHWYNQTNNANYSGQTLRSTTVYNLRNLDGSLGSVSSNQGFYVNDNTPADQWSTNQLQYGSFDLSYTKNTISTPLIDTLLLNFGYRHISNLLENPFTSFPASIVSVQSINKIEPGIEGVSNFCGFKKTTVVDGVASTADYKINNITNVNSSCAPFGVSQLTPDPLLIGNPFFRIRNVLDSNCSTKGLSFTSQSSKSITIYEPGFRIITLTKKANIID